MEILILFVWCLVLAMVAALLLRWPRGPPWKLRVLGD